MWQIQQAATGEMFPSARGLLALVLYLQCGHFQRNVVHLFGRSNELQTVKRVPICFQGEFLLFELQVHLDIKFSLITQLISAVIFYTASCYKIIYMLVITRT